MAPGSLEESAGQAASMSARTAGRGVISTYAGLAVGVLLNLGTTPLVLSGLGARAFGALALASTAAGYLGFIELGTGTATLRRLAAAFARRDDTRLVAVLSANLAVNALFAGIGAIVVVVVTIAFPTLFHIGDDQATAARVSFVLLATVQLITFLTSGYSALLNGSGRLSTMVAFGILSNVSTSVIFIVGAQLRLGIVVIAAGSLAAAIFSAVVVRVVSRRSLPFVRPRLRDASRPLVIELVRSGGYNVVIAVGTLMATGLDLVIVGALFDTQRVAGYAIAAVAVAAARTIATRGTDALSVTYAQSHALDQRLRQLTIFKESLLAGLAVSGAVALALCLLGEPLLQLWLGSPPQGALPVLVLLGAALPLQVVGHSATTVLIATERLRFLAIGCLVAGGANLTVSILLAQRVGITGPAIGTLCAAVLLEGIVLPGYVLRTLGARRVDVVELLLRIVAPLAVLATLLVIDRTLVHRPAVVAAAGVAALVPFVIVLLVCFGSDRRTQYVQLLRR